MKNITQIDISTLRGKDLTPMILTVMFVDLATCLNFNKK
jgi:hypothetical protein